MATTATPPAVPGTPTQTVSVDVKQAVSTIGLDALKSFWPVISTELSNIVKNGSVSNDIAQGLATVPALSASLPTFEQNASQDVATEILADLNAIAASVQAKLSA